MVGAKNNVFGYKSGPPVWKFDVQNAVQGAPPREPRHCRQVQAREGGTLLPFVLGKQSATVQSSADAVKAASTSSSCRRRKNNCRAVEDGASVGASSMIETEKTLS